MSASKYVVFSHGKESGPFGTKIKLMMEACELLGYKTLSVDYTQCANASERVTLLQTPLSQLNTEQLILVGSSMGGYVSTVVACEQKVDGLFLLCPALWMPKDEYEVQEYLPKTNRIEVVHGWNDDIVPYQNSVRFGEQTKATVNLVDDGHRLQDSHQLLVDRLRLFLA